MIHLQTLVLQYNKSYNKTHNNITNLKHKPWDQKLFRIMRNKFSQMCEIFNCIPSVGVGFCLQQLWWNIAVEILQPWLKTYGARDDGSVFILCFRTVMSLWCGRRWRKVKGPNRNLATAQEGSPRTKTIMVNIQRMIQNTITGTITIF